MNIGNNIDSFTTDIIFDAKRIGVDVGTRQRTPLYHGLQLHIPRLTPIMINHISHFNNVHTTPVTNVPLVLMRY